MSTQKINVAKEGGDLNKLDSKESQHIIDEITAICNSLGKLDENDGTYMKDRDCKACLKEIVRYLSSTSSDQAARVTLGSLNVIKSDLIPLMNQYCDFNDGDIDLFALILRLCTNLSSSAKLFFENQDIPTESVEKQLYNKLNNQLQSVKEAFANDDLIWITLNKHLRHNTEDEITFERLIILIRNILQIPTIQNVGINQGYDTHDMCLHHMDKSGMLNTIIHIASNTQFGTEFCFHITEIIYFMLRDQNPKTLALAKLNNQKCKLDELDVDKKRLAELSARERRRKRAESRDLMTSFRFKHTSFTVQNCRSLGDKPLVMRRPPESRESIKFDKGKVDLRKAKNKKPLTSETPMLNSDKNLKSSRYAYSLKLFCKEFLEKVYANYMQQIKHNLIQKKVQDEDEAYYLWAIQFFTAFNRHSNLSMDNISENLSTSTLHFIQIMITSYLDKIKIEKKNFHDSSNKLHLSLRAYREILLLIKSIDKESEFFKTAETIQRKIFSEVEYSTLLLIMFQQYNEPKHSIHYLCDLIQTNSVFLELLQEYSSNHEPVENPDEVLKEKSSKRKRKMDFRAAQSVMKYCCPFVVSAHLSVLRNFKSNEDATNMAILKLFEGIAFDCKNEIILFQASIFQCLLEIMDYDQSLPGYDRFKKLGMHLMEKFGAMANKRRWMFQELLFCKTFNDAMEIQDAIDPPPVMPVFDENLDSENINSTEAQESTSQNFTSSFQQARNESLADLLAELDATDDDEDDDEHDGDDDDNGGGRDGGGGGSDGDGGGGDDDDELLTVTDEPLHSHESQPSIENPDVVASNENSIQLLD